MEGEHKVRPYHDLDKRFNESDNEYAAPRGTKDNTLGRMLQAFKSMTTVEYIRGVKQYGWSSFPGRLWQRNYYERVIRNEDELNRVREYVAENPSNWATDKENPENIAANKQLHGTSP